MNLRSPSGGGHRQGDKLNHRMDPTHRPFRFGVVAPQARTGAEYVALARRVEELGYSTLLLPDTPGPVLVPFSALGVVAGATTRLRVGNWVLANDFRHPVQVAVRSRHVGISVPGPI
jgi:alkanesulfonate monooxygenase SsuD/methylene tetrahydromethanopterin reductase-like flavin-dependent oxidoreductase (luciferase family)